MMSAAPSNVSVYLNSILKIVDLEVPDGRPLYQYRLTNELYEEGLELFNRNKRFFDPSNRYMCAVFVLLISNWCSRKAQNIKLKWEDIQLAPAHWTITERGEASGLGLAYWRIPIRHMNNGKRYLDTMRRSAGLPTKLIVDCADPNNKIRIFFEKIMKNALAYNLQTVGELTAIVESESHRLPIGFQDPLIYELVAELIFKLTEFYKEIPEYVRNSEPAVWLDQEIINWREQLPIFLPDDAELCNSLFKNLLQTKILPSDGKIGVKRQLNRRADGSWEQGVAIDAKGAFNLEILKNYPEGRFRVFFSGAIEQLISNAFANIHMSKDMERGRVEAIAEPLNYPSFIPLSLQEPVAVRLVQNNKSLPPVLWPNGKSAISACYIFKTVTENKRLELLATGSYFSKLEELFILVPLTARVEPMADTQTEIIWQDNLNQLVKIKGKIIVTTSDGDRYRIATDMDGHSLKGIDLKPYYLRKIQFENSDIIPVKIMDDISYQGKLKNVKFLKNNKEVNIHLIKSPTGLYSLKSIDSDGFIIDKAKVFFIPQYFDALKAEISQNFIKIEFPLIDWRFDLLDDHNSIIPVAEQSGKTYIYDHNQLLQHKLRMRLTDYDNTSLIIHLTIDRSEMTLVDGRDQLQDSPPIWSLSQMRGAAIIPTKPSKILFKLINNDIQGFVSRDIDEETPLARFYDLIVSLLAVSAERGPRVEILNDKNKLICTISRSQIAPEVCGEKISFAAIDDGHAEAIVRPLLELDKEYPLEKHDLYYSMPQKIIGGGLVYLRQGDAILTRPKVIVRNLSQKDYINQPELARILLIDDGDYREKLLNEYLDNIKNRPIATELKLIRNAIESLNGLSPRAIDLIRVLPQHSQILCRLFLSTSLQGYEALKNLEFQLPFLWMELPLDNWLTAVKFEINSTIKSMAHLSIELQSGIYRQYIETFKKFKWFQPILKSSGCDICYEGNLKDLVQTHMRNFIDNPYVLDLPWPHKIKKLPQELSNFEFQNHAVLIAPFILAARSLNLLSYDQKTSIALRNAVDIDRTYVEAAFPFCMDFLKNGEHHAAI